MHTRILVGLIVICLLLLSILIPLRKPRPNSTTSTTESVSISDTTTANTLPEKDNTPTEIRTGDNGLLVQDLDVIIRNPEPIGTYSYEDGGSVYADNLIQVVGRKDKEGELLLVRYTASYSPEKNECPTGTLFFMFKGDFVFCKEYYDTKKGEEREQEKNKEEIREILKQEKVNSKKQ